MSFSVQNSIKSYSTKGLVRNIRVRGQILAICSPLDFSVDLSTEGLMLLLSAEPTLPKGPDIILRYAREKGAFNAQTDIKGTDQPARKCRLICALNVFQYGVNNLINFFEARFKSVS